MDLLQQTKAETCLPVQLKFCGQRFSVSIIFLLSFTVLRVPTFVKWPTV